jgi:short-subunit dehydrogenase
LQEHAESTFGPISVVVANAGIFEGGAFLEDKFDESGKLAVRPSPVPLILPALPTHPPSKLGQKPDISSLDINVIGTTYTAKLAFHYLQKSPSKELKSLVILGSVVSYIPSPSAPLYVASKHALLGLARALHLESGDKGIECVLRSLPLPPLSSFSLFILVGLSSKYVY